MKKVMLFALAILLNVAGAKAQKVEEYGIFDHLGVGVSVGTTGIGFDLAAPVTDYLQLRAGYSFMPKLSYTTDLDIVSADGMNVPPSVRDEIERLGDVEVEGKLNMNNFKFLVDIYPFKASKSSFHVTAGAFIGSDKLVSVYNTKPFTVPEHLKEYGVGFDLGDYGIGFDKNGFAHADLKVNGFKPYLGIGYGRAVPKKRVGVQFDMGVQFWGKPGVYRTVDSNGKTSYEKLSKGDFDNEDADEIFDIMEKITVYPVIKLRICGRIF